MAKARGNIFEFSPGLADRRMTDFPRPIGDFPIMPSVPLANFPADWVDKDQTMGNSTIGTLGMTTHSHSADISQIPGPSGHLG